jgi:RNA polymerase sigma-70 factor (ECF subfamily)
MTEDFLAERFQADRRRLRAVAFRMLGDAAAAEDAVQETWLRLSRADMSAVCNLGGWLTTVVARVCLDMLRSRRSRREEPLEPEADIEAEADPDPEAEVALADSVGAALMVVLDRLAPAERLAFVLHDLFDMPFEEIAPIVGRSVEAARQLASRARRRVRGGDAPDPSAERRRIIDAFLTASRGGDMTGLLSLLDPDVVMRADAVAMRLGGRGEVRGAAEVAAFFNGRAQAARPALLDGEIGVSVAPAGKLLVVMEVVIRNGRIAGIEAIADPVRLAAMDVRAL